MFTSMLNAQSIRLALATMALSCLVLNKTSGQTLLSHYAFDGDLTNSSDFIDINGTPAPDGTFRIGTDSVTATVGTATFTTGVDGTPNGAILFDGNSGEGGSDGWVDATTAGHPGATVALQGTPTTDDPLASSGPGLVSGTASVWVRTTNILGARWISGNLNADPSPPFVFDTQAWLLGWDGSGLQAFPRASGPGSSGIHRFIVADPTNDVSWADGEWHHLAFRWNGGAEQGSGEPELASVFLDGVNLGAAPTNHFLDPTDTQNEWQFPLAIGARNNRGTLDGFFDGALDDFRIYSDFLSDEEILGIFNELAPGDENADFDSDGDIDGQDFLAWQEGLGTGSELSDGDANSSGSVDGADLTIWESQFGTTPGAVQASAVPEASSLAILLSGLFSLAVRRR